MQVGEWLKPAVSKTAITYVIGGSNPPLHAYLAVWRSD